MLKAPARFYVRAAIQKRQAPDPHFLLQAAVTMFDPLILGLDKALRTVFSLAVSARKMPTPQGVVPDLSVEERKVSAALMRVNHVGEVCAQALYQGQAVTCRSPEIRQALEAASNEEADHLAWTEQRINELGGRKSVLNPLWYLGAFSLGAFAGKLGDDWSLGFLAETERQVEAHLARHLSLLPATDVKSLALVEQMRIDEHSHAETAIRLGGHQMPGVVRQAMSAASGVMTRVAYVI